MDPICLLIKFHEWRKLIQFCNTACVGLILILYSPICDIFIKVCNAMNYILGLIYEYFPMKLNT